MKMRPVVWFAAILCVGIFYGSKIFLSASARDYLRAHRSMPGIGDEVLNPIRLKMEEKIDRQIPPRFGSIAKAMLLGNQKDMPYDVRQSFSYSGTAHLLAISGGNIALVALCAVFVLRLFYVPRKILFACAIAFLVFYCLLTGASASIVRATIMVSMILSGAFFRREPEILLSLAWSAILILVYDPLQLFDLGFQLSFVSVFMLAAASDGSDELDPETKPGIINKIIYYLEESVTISVAAWIGTMPLSAQVFGTISPVAIVANLVLVPYFSFLQVSGFLFLVFGSVHHKLEDILGASFSLICEGALKLSDWFVSWPMSHFQVRPMENFEIAIFYSIILLWAFRNPIRRKIIEIKQRYETAQ